MTRSLSLALLFLVLLTPAAGGEAEPPPGSAEAEPGYLDILGGTAVSLEGDLEEGIEGATFLWRIVEGEGGQLFNDDRPSAVFLAPNVATGMKRFVIDMTVSYRDAPSSTRRLVIRVLSEEFVDKEGEGEGEEEDPTAWLKERYRREAEAEARKQDRAPEVIVPGGRSGSSVSIGVGVGPGGYRGGRIGFRFSLSYPIEQPVDVPPPGQTLLPGQGTWDLPYPVPYQDLKATFPASVAERYAPPPEPAAESPADPPAETDRDDAP
jgi:hypothetical protein